MTKVLGSDPTLVRRSTYALYIKIRCCSDITIQGPTLNFPGPTPAAT